MKNRRTFLKRSESKTVGQRDLYIGSVVTVLARQLKITDYADVSTRKKFELERGKYATSLLPPHPPHALHVPPMIISIF